MQPSRAVPLLALGAAMVLSGCDHPAAPEATATASSAAPAATLVATSAPSLPAPVVAPPSAAASAAPPVETAAAARSALPATAVRLHEGAPAPTATATSAVAVSAAPTVTAAPAAPAPPAPSVTSAPVAGAAYSVWMQAAGRYQAGQQGAVQVVLVPASGYHCNPEYPYKLALGAPPAGLSYPEPVVRKGAMSVAPARGVMSVPIVPGAPGAARVSGTFSFSVCNEASCVIDKREVAITVKVE